MCLHLTFEDANKKAIQVYEKGLPCSEMPDNIKNWPARSNAILGDITEEYLGRLANFYDRNLGGIYNPCDGDLPAILNVDF